MAGPKPPEMRSDGKGPHPPVMEMFVTKEQFHEYVIDNRDRQDANKKEIITTLEKAIETSKDNFEDDIDDLGGRVGNLEDGAKKQTLIATTVATIGGVITGIIAYILRGE